MRLAFGLRLALLTVLGMTASGIWNSASAVQFGQQDVNEEQVIAIAAPYGNNLHQLLILEQISNTRPCWEENGNSPTLVDPLLLDFDFTDICGRSTDSNGYSVRVGGQDLGWQYSLRVIEQGNDLVLVAVSTTNPSSPALEIGRTNGATDEFAKINLASGWRMTRRTYNGQSLPHIYLTHDQDLTTLIAAASPTTPTLPTLPTRPTTPPSTGNPPSRPTLPTVPAESTDEFYRVVVQASTPVEQALVRRVAPDAFQTTVDGRSVMQAGLFRDEATANEIQQRLQEARLQSRVITVDAEDVAFTPPSTLPTIPVPGNDRPLFPTQPNPENNLPTVPNDRFVVVIDPGHGGSDPGAVGIGGLRETDVVFPISQQVTALLQQQGVEVVMTRQDDRTVELEPRVALAERVDADLFISIHANAAASDANGVETYYYGSDAGRELAESIQTNLVQSTGMTDRGVKSARFYVIAQTSMPAALVEVGFVTGSQDVRVLNNSASRSQIAGSIARGILEYIDRNF